MPQNNSGHGVRRYSLFNRYVVCTDERVAWEAMLVETVPILLSADHAVGGYLPELPVLWLNSYADVSRERLETEYEALRHRQYKMHLLYSKSVARIGRTTPSDCELCA